MELLPRESILYSLAPSSLQSTGSICLVDFATPNPQNPLATWKGAPAAGPNSLAFVPSSPHLGGILVHSPSPSTSKTPLLHIHSFSSNELLVRLHPPAPLRTLAISPAGDYLAAGTNDGHLFLWDLKATDEGGCAHLLASWDAHYRAITKLVWTVDSAALVTASEDSRVVVWSTFGMLNPSSSDKQAEEAGIQSTVPSPYATLTDHTLPITDIAVSSSGHFPSTCRVWSASADGSVKVWDLRTRSLLSTYLFPRAISHIAVESSERFFFAASNFSAKTELPDDDTNGGGIVYRVDLYRLRNTSSQSGHPVSWEARGGGGAAEAERIKDEEAYIQGKVIRIP